MFDTTLLHLLDIRAYQLAVGVWDMYWPVLLITIVFTLIERCFPLEREQPWRGWLFNMAWHALVLAIGVILSWTAWGEFVAWLSGGGVAPTRVQAPQGLADELARLVLVLLVYDFCIYWAHRLQHAVPALWAMHQFHHEERHMNAAASLRSHWLNIPYLQLLVTIPVVWLLGFEAYTFTVYLVIHIFLGYSHMNVRLDLGRISRLLVGPQYHRMHHARERRHYDCNFATLLPLWDMLFGTFQPPVAGEFGPTGVSGNPTTRAWIAASLQPIIDWWRMLKSRFVRA